MGTDRCILCEAPRPLTEEHVWSDWYSRFLPEDLKFYFEGTINGRDYNWPAQKFNVAPNCLCKPCNNEWASKKLEIVSDFMKPMTQGEITTLSAQQITQLAGWMTLKAMVLDCIRSDPSDWFYTQAQRSYLRHTLMPPHGTRIWIGRYVGERSRTGKAEEDRSWLQSSEGTKLHDTWSLVFTIGEVLFHLHAVQGLPTTRNTQIPQRPLAWDRFIYRLWPLPAQPYNWPPPRLGDGDWPLILGRFDPPRPPSPRPKRLKQ